MLQKLIKSPIVPLFLFILLVTFFIFSLYNPQDEKQLLARICLFLLTALTFIWTILIRYYNQKHPENRIRFSGLLPSEFLDMDEGQQWVTHKACRNVYIFFSVGLPVTAGICFLFSEFVLTPFFAIGFLGIGQYLVYWLTVRKLNKY
ncbi:hypothetical protein KFD70_03710 [Bacillus pfraonensis]|uniref:hypothetical protein n=1 Tax=Bacillus TaxID=1386 RepID=UPI002A5658CF|nr:hypothetical protein [Bacillus pseudomycoides]